MTEEQIAAIAELVRAVIDYAKGNSQVSSIEDALRQLSQAMPNENL